MLPQSFQCCEAASAVPKLPPLQGQGAELTAIAEQFLVVLAGYTAEPLQRTLPMTSNKAPTLPIVKQHPCAADSIAQLADPA